MPQTSLKLSQLTKLSQSIIKTLAFFSLYDLPIHRERLYELLDIRVDRLDFEREVNILINRGSVFDKGGLVALAYLPDRQAGGPVSKYERNQNEIAKKKEKVNQYFGWLSLLPFVRQISIINSLAIGNADSESDIDFFVVTSPRRLYFVRSVIIVLFRALGVYKTRHHIADRFCFGFFVSANNLNLKHLLLKPADPYLVFWLASMQPLISQNSYLRLIQANNWIYEHLPNFDPQSRIGSVRKRSLPILLTKLVLEMLLWLPAEIMEPIARAVHIRHTFKLPENLSKTSTTVANKDMLKLHAADVRREIAAQYEAALQRLD